MSAWPRSFSPRALPSSRSPQPLRGTRRDLRALRAGDRALARGGGTHCSSHVSGVARRHVRRSKAISSPFLAAYHLGRVRRAAGAASSAYVEDSTVAALTLTGGADSARALRLPVAARDALARAPDSSCGWRSCSGALSPSRSPPYSGIAACVFLGATRTGIYLHFEPVFALLAAWIWLGEHPTPLQGVGAVTILAGVTLTHT